MPSSFTSAVWGHFGLSVDYDERGKKTVNKQSAVCKHCFSMLVYSSCSTSNMLAHLRRNHPAINISGATRKDGFSTKTQTTISAAFQHQCLLLFDIFTLNSVPCFQIGRAMNLLHTRAKIILIYCIRTVSVTVVQSRESNQTMGTLYRCIPTTHTYTN